MDWSTLIVDFYENKLLHNHFSLPSPSTKWYILVDYMEHGCHAFGGKSFLLFLSLFTLYRPPTNLGEGIAFSCVCHSVCSQFLKYYYSASWSCKKILLDRRYSRRLGKCQDGVSVGGRRSCCHGNEGIVGLRYQQLRQSWVNRLNLLFRRTG